jgi:hypothetical protein
LALKYHPDKVRMLQNNMTFSGSKKPRRWEKKGFC